jgi:hypothetical protein
MKSGRHDGSRRNYFFPRIEAVETHMGDIESPCASMLFSGASG